MNTKSYFRLLDKDNRVRNTFDMDCGEIVRFVVQFETRVEGKWYPVVRYDTAHGFAHRDRLSPKGEKTKTILPQMSYNEALTFAQNDIQINWNRYLDQFLKEFSS